MLLARNTNRIKLFPNAFKSCETFSKFWNGFESIFVRYFSFCWNSLHFDEFETLWHQRRYCANKMRSKKADLISFYTWKGNYFHRKLDHFDLLKERHIKVEWNTARRLSTTKKANNLVETHWTIFLLQTKCFT